jgi:hypothetical protein
MEVSCQFHAMAACSQGKEPRYPTDKRLGGPQDRVGHPGEQKNLFTPHRIERCFLGLTRRSLATTQTIIPTQVLVEIKKTSLPVLTSEYLQSSYKEWKSAVTVKLTFMVGDELNTKPLLLRLK